jgi:hypothetical protein
MCFLLSKSIPGLIQDTIYKSERIFQLYLTPSGCEQKGKIMSFFLFLDHYAKLTIAEVIQIFYVFNRYIEKDRIEYESKRKVSITKNNLGTFLVCCVLIGLKISRDIPYNNSWYADKLGIPLKLLSDAELLFLKKIEFDCVLSEDKYQDFCQRFLPLITQQESTQSQNETRDSDSKTSHSTSVLEQFPTLFSTSSS